LKAERDAINAHQEAAEKAWGKCPPGGGGGKESEEEEEEQEEETGLKPPTETISVVIATDGGEWCTYGDGVAQHTSITVTDEAGAPVADIGPRETPTAPEGTPETPELTEKVPEEPPTTPPTPELTEEVPEQPPTTPETPELTEEVPEQPPTTPETPELTEKVPEQPPTTPETPELTEEVPEDQPPSEIPDTIFVKAKESVLEGEPTGKPIENQVVKLFPPEEPELPGTGVNKQAEDTGFDKDPVECTTGADGDCKMQVPVEDRALYDLPSTDEKPGKNYRVDYDLPKDSGGVAETTGKRIKPDVKTGTPDGAEVTVAEFKIGDRTFIRLVYEQPYGLDHDFDEQFKPILGDGYEEDYCREKQPGAPLGMQPDSLSSLNHDLPEATVKLGGTVPAPGDTP
jgi:hypothetical protein